MDLLGNDISIDEIAGARVPDDTEFALESILAEFGDESAPVSPPEPEEVSLPIEAVEEGDGVESAFLYSADLEPAVPRTPAPRVMPAPPEEPAPELSPAPPEEPELSPEPEAEPEPDFDAEPEPEFSPGPEPEYEPEPQPELIPGQPAEAENGEDGQPDEGPAAQRSAEPPRRSFGEALSAPLLSLLAIFTIKRKQRSSGGAAVAREDEEDMGPELPAAEASRYYAGHAKSLRLRTRLAAFLCIILVWISFGLPAAGALGSVPAVTALVCLILELSVAVVGLDIFTSGITAILRGKPSMWSLVSVSCLVSALDAAVSAALNEAALGPPFCAVSALSMTFALFGALQTCRGTRLSLRVLALSRKPYAVTAEGGVTEDGLTLLKSQRSAEGYLRRCEEPDCAETVYGAMAPFLLGGGLLLALIAAAVSKQWSHFFRILAAVTAPMAPFAAFLAFPLPYSIITRRIFQSGAAIAGWAGLRDIGKSRHIIVTDRDIFPAGTLSVESIRILEGSWPEKVISCAGSVICASGSGLAPVFTELMRRNNCSMQRVEDFCCHEGGGLTATINGEEVLCGGAGFMHLMGIRLPQKLSSKTSVFVSISGVLTGVFTIKYVPVTSVQDALASLLHTRRDPIFAIRDFNITPLMIRQKFRMPTDGFDFPSFARRYEISAAEPSPDSLISAILSREGLGPLVEVSDRGRKLYIAAYLATVLSVLCTLIGVVLMFFLCFSGSLDSATVSNLMTYLLLWLVPTVILAFGLGR